MELLGWDYEPVEATEAPGKSGLCKKCRRMQLREGYFSQYYKNPNLLVEFSKNKPPRIKEVQKLRHSPEYDRARKGISQHSPNGCEYFKLKAERMAQIQDGTEGFARASAWDISKDSGSGKVVQRVAVHSLEMRSWINRCQGNAVRNFLLRWLEIGIGLPEFQRKPGDLPSGFMRYLDNG